MSEMKKEFGKFGGQFVPETLKKALVELERHYVEAMEDKVFQDEYKYYVKEYSGRPTPLYFAENITKDLDGGKVYLKREDLNHTGSHKINNVIGQVLLAKRMGKKRIIAETGAGQHGVATATVCAMFGLDCEIFMGEKDIRRQSLNVFKMKLLGAKINSVSSGTGTLNDAVNEAMKDWILNADNTFYVIGSVVGPHPYPTMVRNFQKIIGEEVKEQIFHIEGRYPDYLIACVGGGSNSMGLFYPFCKYKDIKMYGVEAGGLGIDTNKHAATITKGSIGIIHGMMTYLIQDNNGKVMPVHSISAGLDYPGVGPEHAYLHSIGRVNYVSVTDWEAVDAFQYLTKFEGIIPALESSHAIAYLKKLAPNTNKDDIIIVNLSGRGDKDIYTVSKFMKSYSKI
ncbi:tryptophan synthase, beta chain [Caminicella sporogenes DSM 14501]|uniref:Tryptophan synthase beta chain n=1 Tax=Caminicella sporogenes DSM 14501 TaxID=1121266 RepID=A0A1M6SLS1_9FIRM|nr:tryptophan synthase subunit beta [Caminicella sporogenes]SHK45655.1 tryptophan synthase, beta chain [Caminicella sporogenes DSM 14501]